MAKLVKSVTDLIKELTALQNSAAPGRVKDDDFLLPRMIPTGDGRSIIVSKKVDQIIASVARRMNANDPALSTSHTDAEWITAVRNAFGAALLPIDLDANASANAAAVLTEVKAILKAQIPSGSMEYAFGCTLFGECGYCSHWKLVPRAARHAPGMARPQGFRRSGLEGHAPPCGARVAGAKAPQAQVVLRQNPQNRTCSNAIGTCPYVCSVSTVGLAPEAGKEKALMAARLALTGVALLWGRHPRHSKGSISFTIAMYAGRRC